MSQERKTLAKYGAKIPVARSTGAKPAAQGEANASAQPAAKAKSGVSKGGDKKRNAQ
jgi:hypothetical protein